MPKSKLTRPQWTITLVNKLPSKLRFLPFPAVAIILSLILVNVIIWAAVGFVLHFHTSLASTALLSYTLGLRHALDADHISAIDLMTRRLIASGQRPVTVGTFFSLGHSTIVVITCVVVAATAGALEKRFDGFSNVGGIIGTSVSAAFLIILGIGNAWILVILVKRLRQILAEPTPTEQSSDAVPGLNLEGGGFLVRVFKRVFKLIDRPWKMYPLGILFGMGFDTSSEIAVLGIASIQGAKGTSLWLILVFPILFTAGMCLIDTTDGALMMTLYTSTSLARDTIAILYYSIVLTAITVFVAVAIGTCQLLSLIAHFTDPEESFALNVGKIGEYYDVIGGVICGAFVLFGIASVVMYKPWRRWIEKRRGRVWEGGRYFDNEEAGDVELIDIDGKPDTVNRKEVSETVTHARGIV